MTNQITARLHKFIAKIGYSIRTVADISDISNNTLRAILDGETTNPGILTLDKICESLGISLCELLCDDERETVVVAGTPAFDLLEDFENLSAHGRSILLELFHAFLLAFPRE